MRIKPRSFASRDIDNMPFDYAAFRQPQLQVVVPGMQIDRTVCRWSIECPRAHMPMSRRQLRNAVFARVVDGNITRCAIIQA